MRKREAELFSEAEYMKAFEFVTNPTEARELAKELSETDSVDDGDWFLSPDVLDLLSIVSDDCAERVRVILNLTPEEAEARRNLVKNRLAED